jgi:hypothetical protein
MTLTEASRSGHMVGSEVGVEPHGSRGTEGTWLQPVYCTFLMYDVPIFRTDNLNNVVFHGTEGTVSQRQ